MPGPIKMGGTRFCPLIPSDLASLHRACLPHLKVSSFFDNCMLDMCNFQGLQQILCGHMSALTETCQEAGYAVKPWRGPQFCRESCEDAGPLSSCSHVRGLVASENGGTGRGVRGRRLVEPLHPYTRTRKSAGSETSPEKITGSPAHSGRLPRVSSQLWIFQAVFSL